MVVDTNSDKDFRDKETNVWTLLHVRDNSVIPLASGVGEVSDLWVSPLNTVYLIALYKKRAGLHIGRLTPAGFELEWQSSVQANHTSVARVWGLSDAHVFAWGGGILRPEMYPTEATSLPIDNPCCWLTSGSGWVRYPSLGFVYALHGQGMDSVVAVGRDALVAAWKEDHWERLPSPKADFTRVQVTPSGEIYGISYGDVFSYSEARGWRVRVPGMGYVGGFAQWNQALYLLRDQGLYCLKGGKAVLVQPAIRSAHLTAGDVLLWNDASSICEWSASGLRSFATQELFSVVVNYLEKDLHSKFS